MPRKRRNEVLSVTYSLLLHGILFAFIVVNSLTDHGEGDDSQGRYKDQPIAAEIIDKIPEASDHSDPSSEMEAPEGIIPPAPTHLQDRCPNFFGGVGLTQGYIAGQVVITEISHGYPAEKVGLQVGDVLLNSEGIRGEIGTPYTIKVMRNGQLLEFPIIRDKICTE